MKVIFAIPTITGSIRVECVNGLFSIKHILQDAKIDYDLFTISDCPYLPTARNTLVSMFMEDKDNTDLFFIDADVGFDAAGAMKILQRPEEIVAGIYPLKRDIGGYPVQVKTEDGIPIGRDGLIEAEFLPTGFMRIKRVVFERIQKAYPDLRYTDSVVNVDGVSGVAGFDYFNMGVDKERQRFTTEDYAFCQRWRDIGGQLWVYPDIDFSHIGRKQYKGNYHQFLMRQPGGILAGT
jgi:hypothetical protein